jgi:hypothetical protein
MSEWEVPVPFSDEEMDRLSALAAVEGASVADYVRLRVFGPSIDVGSGAHAAQQKPAVANNQEWVAFYDRLLAALTAMRARAMGG